FIGENAAVRNTIIGDGCEINGTVEHSVIFSDVIVEEGACVKDSVIMAGTVIRKGACVEYAIVDSDAEIGADAVVGSGGSPDQLTIIAKDAKVAGGETVLPGTVVE
ncbi:MAG: glucose-1-phosphate adenylyltransferase, partial [Eubacterium sp.]|nr:glucose-1-phosphate adenylyltransferase [Eubacterium sp.]